MMESRPNPLKRRRRCTLTLKSCCTPRASSPSPLVPSEAVLVVVVVVVDEVVDEGVAVVAVVVVLVVVVVALVAVEEAEVEVVEGGAGAQPDSSPISVVLDKG